MVGLRDTYEKKMDIRDIGDHSPVSAALRMW